MNKAKCCYPAYRGTVCVVQAVNTYQITAATKCSCPLTARPAPPYLLLRGRAELLGLLGGERGGHVERLHHLVVAELLVGLEAGHEVVGEGHHRLDAVAHLAVTQVLQQAAQDERDF